MFYDRDHYGSTTYFIIGKYEILSYLFRMIINKRLYEINSCTVNKEI